MDSFNQKALVANQPIRVNETFEANQSNVESLETAQMMSSQSCNNQKQTIHASGLKRTGKNRINRSIEMQLYFPMMKSDNPLVVEINSNEDEQEHSEAD